MTHRLCLCVVLLVLGAPLLGARADSWECGGAKIHCGGSTETCDALKRACTAELQASSDVDRELTEAVRQAQNGSLPHQSGDPFERLTRVVMFQGCTEQQAKEGKCGVIYNAKELVSSVVDTLRYSADALNQASAILGGK